MRSPARSRWCRWGSRARGSPRVARCASSPRPDRAGIRMFAEVPTTAELGLPDVRMDTWFGLIGPPGMPEPIVARLVRDERRSGEPAVVPRQALQDRLRRGLDAAGGVHGLHALTTTRNGRELIPAMGIPPIE